MEKEEDEIKKKKNDSAETEEILIGPLLSPAASTVGPYPHPNIHNVVLLDKIPLPLPMLEFWIIYIGSFKKEYLVIILG